MVARCKVTATPLARLYAQTIQAKIDEVVVMKKLVYDAQSADSWWGHEEHCFGQSRGSRAFDE
jgi:hypothetical protein